MLLQRTFTASTTAVQNILLLLLNFQTNSANRCIVHVGRMACLQAVAAGVAASYCLSARACPVATAACHMSGRASLKSSAVSITFITDTIGSVSSCRMPTTDITCTTQLVHNKSCEVPRDKDHNQYISAGGYVRCVNCSAARKCCLLWTLLCQAACALPRCASPCHCQQDRCWTCSHCPNMPTSCCCQQLFTPHLVVQQHTAAWLQLCLVHKRRDAHIVLRTHC